jgi:hypothetical protein
MKAGAVMGNHYHNAFDFLYLTAGAAAIKTARKPARDEFHLESGQAISLT